MTAKETVKAICEALIEKKAQGIEVLHVERLTELTEYFVICSASSTTQVKALADNVEWHLKYDHDEMPHHTEGYESAQWMLLDYGCAVLHVFMPEARKFYNLENLWKDGTPVTLEELGIETSKIPTCGGPGNVSAALSRSKSKTHFRGRIR